MSGEQEVVLAPGADGDVHLKLTADSALLAPTYSSYRLTARSRAPRLLLVVGTCWDACTADGVPEQHEILTQEDATGVTPRGDARWEARALLPRVSRNGHSRSWRAKAPVSH